MKYIMDSEKMKQIDQYSTDVIKIPAIVLMERAAAETAAVMKKNIKKSDRILVICGSGNNAGDGIAAGRILFLQGYTVAIFLCCEEEKCSSLMKSQLDIAKNLGIPIENYNKLPEYNIIIDALFGVGLSRAVTGNYETVINGINDGDNIVFSVDMPSGISADTGKIMNAAVRADYTITFGYPKQGLLVYPGAAYAGEITVADIGFPELALSQIKKDTFFYDMEDLERIPDRPLYSNKGTFGKVLVIAGSRGMSGAAYLSAKAAYRTGAGLVKILTHSENRQILQSLLPEALFGAYDADQRPDDEVNREIITAIKWASAIVIGPGLGQSKEAEKLLEMVIKYSGVPAVIDADALNILSKRPDMPENDVRCRLGRLGQLLPEGTVLTPHLLELSRLIGIPSADIADNIIDTAGQCSYNRKMIYAIKDARTIVTYNGAKYINLSGNNGMATGGSGDVLTGIIAALIAQGLNSYEAACLAVYIHGLAGDTAAKEKCTYSLMASDIADAIEKVMRKRNNFI